MIPARKSPFFNAWFARHATQRLARSFSGVYAHNLEPVLDVAGKKPLVVVSNHTSWWDPLVAIWLGNKILRIDGYAMMDEKNLHRLPFFGKVGAFGVDLSTPGAGRESIQYAVNLLSAPERLVWIFAQGRERPVTERPLGFRRGSAVIATHAQDSLVVPLALRYDLLNKERPYLFLSFGEPRTPLLDIESERNAQELAVTSGLEAIDRHVRLERGPDAVVESSFAPLMSHRPRLLVRMAEWLLARLTRPKRLEATS